MSTTTPKITKAVRKHLRRERRNALLKDHREACRTEIKRMRNHNAHTSVAEDRFAPEAFRASLKRLNRDFSRAVAGKPVARP